MNNFFSIIVPVYNGQKYIQETLDSIYAQTYKNYEIIVVDGLSTDNTLEILQNNSSSIKKIISEKDCGMYDALSKGFELATGNIFCYINSDDRLLPYSLELVNKKFNEDNYDLVFGNVNYISDKGNIIYTYKAFNYSYKVIRILQRLPFAQQSAFWTKEIYKKKMGFDVSLKYVADSKFFFNVCLDPTIKKSHINKPLGQYRMHNSSFSVGSLNKMKLESTKMKEEFSFKKSIFRRMVFEMFLKTINTVDVIKKLLYVGPKI